MADIIRENNKFFIEENEITNKLESTNVTTCYSPNNGETYTENDTWDIDECTKCICKDGIVLCHTIICPSNLCPIAVYNKNMTTCCPNCSMIDQIKIPVQSTVKFWSCFDKNHNKKPHGSMWKENDCLYCKCINGESKCLNEQCTKTSCLQNIFKKGQCCPYCLDNITSPYILSNSFIEDFTTKPTSKSCFYLLDERVKNVRLSTA